MIKLLTGQAIHEAFNETSKWHELSTTELGKRIQARYNEIAKTLNQALGLCENCGNRPADGVLLEVAGDNMCSDCCNPPVDEHDPNVQYMHFIPNADGTLAGAIVPPAGMSLEEYKAKLTEEMNHISFNLTDPNGITTVGAKNLSELYDFISNHVPIALPDQPQPYQIRIYKDHQDLIGFGQYKRTWDSVEVVSETGAAQGLNDVLYEYAFRNA